MKKIAILLLAFILAFSAEAQNSNVPRSLRSGAREAEKGGQNDQKVTFFVSGNVNNNFGPQLALDLEGGLYATPWLRFGAGPRYEMTFNQFANKVSHAAGASAFAEFIIANYIMGHIGYEFLNYPTYEKDEFDNFILTKPTRKNIHALALGVGFQTHVSETVRIQAQYIIYPFQTQNDYYVRFLPMFARIGVSVDL
ncbi:MAG: hypothetical protein IJQ94_04900 [Bacteroidales bacterium]|nr:hypothetical protein [Bacteroidales bacterium]MBR0304963.1 hypothetical protein [Bacteroidales bacterium]